MGGPEKPVSPPDAPVRPVNLRVPTHQIEPLALLLRATDEQFAAFERELARIERPSGIRRLVVEAARRAGWPELQSAESLAGLLVSLSSISDNLPDISTEDFAARVARAAEATGNEKLRAARAQWDVLADRLGRLLGSKSPLWLLGKATVLQTEQERLFCDARILTDIRPIFDRQAAVGPAALSVIHTLKLMYHTSSESLEEFFLALDSDDLLALKKVIQRAEEKQEALESLVRRTGIPLLSVKND